MQDAGDLVPEDAVRSTQEAAAAPEAPGALSRLLLELAQAPEEDLAASWQGTLKPGEVVGRYQIRDEIGRGGFGAVYEAFDPELGRAVALKALRPGRTRRELSADWIKKEAEAVARLDHPGIVTVFDVGTCPAGPYLVMELLHGETLQQRLEKGPLPPDEALRVAEEMARALAHAHHRGVLHRDLKPANVFLTEDGRVKLLDFGLAHLLGREGGSSGGTPAYMAPEQARGEPVDERADVYAAAMVLGETLTGKRPEPPAAPRDAPRPLQRAVAAGLAPDREGRCRDGTVWLQALAQARRALGRPRLVRRLAAVAVLCLAAVGWFLYREARIRWALQVALPRATELAATLRWEEAFALAQEVERIVAGDPRLLELLPLTSSLYDVETTPPGASVSVKPYTSPEAEWRPLGTSPLSGVRLPRGLHRWRFEKDGHAPAESVGGRVLPVAAATGKVRAWLPEAAQVPPEMVFVKGGEQTFPVPRLAGLPPVHLGDFLIDRHEVTNREYKRFVDAGGYGNRDLWREEIVRDGRVLTWEEAMAAFRDRTGGPGPASWQSGSYPEGQEDLPVTGVSWHEAAAYARFVGKSLPTAYQWYRAAWVPMGFEIVRLSNFGSEGLAPAGRFRGMSRVGAYDMAGNAKEWCWNESGGMRGVLGGAWDEAPYAFGLWDARDPFARAPNVGFRLARDLGGGTAPEAAASLTLAARRDYALEKPVAAEIARAFARIYDYDRTPLDAHVESVDDAAPGWRKEKVGFAAAYGGERVTAYLYTPRGFPPPLQTVVYFPGSDALSWRSSAKMDVDVPTFQDLLRAGRAVLYPVYQSTYERGDGFAEDTPAGKAGYRDHVVMWTKDLRRSLDWVETRQDLDANRVALYGYSWGAALGPLLAAVDERIRVGLLVAGGLDQDEPSQLPESDPFNYTPLVRQPMLMVNGRYDLRVPYETSQRPFFQLLGSAEKRHAVFDFGHMVPFDVAGREMNAWLDRHLGPVR